MRWLRFLTAGSRLTQSQRIVLILHRRHEPVTGCCRNALLFPSTVSTCRPISLSSVPTVLLPPVIFTGLLVTLWTYKCVMMIVFQNKIIYMPSVPPFSRSEKIQDYVAQCRPVTWKEHNLQAADGVALKMLEGGIELAGEVEPKTHVVILYLQGNASSLPPRLPLLSPVLKSLHSTNKPPRNQTRYTIYALSYRGFWTSRGRATQRGIELDVQAALNWLSAHIPQTHPADEAKLVLWGQSIGAAIATTALANHLAQPSPNNQSVHSQKHLLPIHSLVLETPFLSIRSMLVALYPQKFLPYRYLWPFLRSTWDSEAAIRSIAQSAVSVALNTGRRQQGRHVLQETLILRAGKDEIVPAEQSEALDRVCRKSLPGVHVRTVVVEGALHTEVMARAKGREAVVRLLESVGGRG